MHRLLKQRYQRGAVIVTTALVLLFLLGFMGIALDLGRLFVVKTELQTAMDSCALAAAQELDEAGESAEDENNAITRARNAGMTAGNLNRVNFQSATWNDKGRIEEGDITFMDAFLVETTIPKEAKYVRCHHTHSDVPMWLLNLMGVFSGNPDSQPDRRSVGAFAVATRTSAQTACPIPIALKPKAGHETDKPNYGFLEGEWITVYGDKAPGSGEFGWYNLDGSTSAKSAVDQLLNPECETTVGTELGTPGAKTSLHSAWNYRFGIYKNGDGFPESIGANPGQIPDYSGYSYTPHNWKNTVPQNAWSGTPAAGSHATAENFLAKRAKFASYADEGADITAGSLITFGDANALNSFHRVATPGASGQHKQYGASRRVATAPVINTSNKVIDFVCIFMLHPMSGPTNNAQVEFLGNAGKFDSPCVTHGLAGGIAGPLVPVLVQ